MGDVTVIDIVAQVTDRTGAGAASATENVSKLEKTMQKVQSSIDKMKKMSKLELTMYAVDKASQGIDGVLKKGASIAGKVWSITMKAVDLVTAPVQGIINLLKNPVIQAASIAGITFGVADTISTYADFEQSMANIAAVTGASENEMKVMENMVRDMSKEFGISATEIGTAFKFIAEAGGDTEQMLADMRGSLLLATASGEDFGMVTELMAGMMKAFGDDVMDSERVANILSTAISMANTDISQMGEALKYAAPGAMDYGNALEELSAMIGLMANSYITGSQAGTTLRQTLSRLNKATEENKNKIDGYIGTWDDAVWSGKSFTQQMETLTASTKTGGGGFKELNAMLGLLGITTSDSKGKLKDLNVIFDEVRAATGGLTEADKQYAATVLAGMDAQSGFLAIINSTDEELDDMRETIYGANDAFDGLGQATGMAKKQSDTMKGSFNLLRSAADEFKLSIGEKAAPYIRQFASWLTDKIPSATEAAVSAFEWAEGKVKGLIKTIKSISSTEEWENANFFGKVKILWDEIIWQPLTDWWDTKGKAKVASVANSIGSGMGTAIKWGISALFGLDVNGAIDDGVSIGKSFADGFSKGVEGIDWGKVVGGLKDALMSVIKLIFSNPVTGTIAGTWLAGKVLSVVSGGYKTVKGISTIAKTPLISAAGSAGTTAATAVGAGSAATVGTVAAAVGGVALGIAGVVSAVGDFAKATKTYNNNLQEKVSGGVKFGLVASGAVLGGIIAGPVGAAVGAGVGGLVALVAGSEIGGAIAGWIDGTGKIYKTTEELKKAADAYDKITEKVTLTKSAIENYYEATELLSQSDIEDSVRNDVLEAQKSAIEKIQELYPGLISQYDIEKGKLEEKLKLIEKISDHETRQAKSKLESTVIEGRKNVDETTYKIGEAQRNKMRWQNQVDNLLSYSDELEDIKSGFTTLDWEYEIGDIGFVDFKKREKELIQRTISFGKDANITGINQYNIRGGQYADIYNNEISKLLDSIEKEQETIDKLMDTKITQYSNEIKLMDINYGGGLVEDIETLRELQKSVDELDYSNLSEANMSLIEEYEGLKGKVGDYEQAIADLNKQYSDIPSIVKTTFEIEIDLTNPEVMEKIEKFIFDTSNGLVFDNILNKFNEPTPTGLSESLPTIDFTDLWWDNTSQNNERSYINNAISAILDKFFGNQNAEGGFFTSPEMGVYGEDGPEFIIPVGANRRQRGLSLWEKAGEMLGVRKRAEGGVFGQGTVATVQGTGGGAVVPVTIENVTFDIKIDGAKSNTDDIVSIIKENVKNLTDEIAYNLAMALQQKFANTPLTAWED